MDYGFTSFLIRDIISLKFFDDSSVISACLSSFCLVFFAEEIAAGNEEMGMMG